MISLPRQFLLTLVSAYFLAIFNRNREPHHRAGALWAGTIIFDWSMSSKSKMILEPSVKVGSSCQKIIIFLNPRPFLAKKGRARFRVADGYLDSLEGQ